MPFFIAEMKVPVRVGEMREREPDRQENRPYRDTRMLGQRSSAI